MISDNLQTGPSIRDFVFQDALERAFQTSIKGIKEYENQKRSIYRQRKQAVTGQFDKKNKEKMVEKRIYRSSLINKSRMHKMQARNNAIMKIVSVSQTSILKDIIGNAALYKDLLKKLIIEGLIKLFEQKVVIRCLERDQVVIQSLLPQCKEQYEALLKKQIDQTITVEITINNRQYLTQRRLTNSDTVSVEDYTLEKSKQEIIKKSQEDSKCFGGVILTTEDGLIICKNTLDTRIDLAFSNILPKIRSTLFSSE